MATALLDHPLMDELQREGVPMVMVNRRPDGVDVPSITPDDAAGMRDGRRPPRRARAPPDRPPRRTGDHLDRRRPAPGFARGPRPGLDEDPALVVTCEHWTEEAGAAALRALLDDGPDFTAIVAGNDLIALGCYDVFAERGMRCPQDMSVVGFNDMPFLDKLRPADHAAIPHQQIGAEAARMLLDAIAEPGRQAVLCCFPSSTVRSTAPPPPKQQRRAESRVEEPII